MADTDTSVAVPADLWAAILDTLHRVGCQWGSCGGEDLDPMYAVTCGRCATLARVRALSGGHRA